jgi:hypothetical protein
MTLTHRFHDALIWSADLHRDQFRKGTEIPYLSHLLSVSALVLEHGGDEDQAIAGLLHDSIEDTDVTDDAIAQRSGSRVAEIVRACTDADTFPKPPWRERKQAYIDHLASAPVDALLVSLADKVHNARAIAADVEREGESYMDRFNGGRAGTRWYYRRLADAFNARAKDLTPDRPGRPGATGLVAELFRAIERFGATEASAAKYESEPDGKGGAPTCPDCGRRAREIVYGLPSPELFERKDVVLGGCVVSPDAPNWDCSRCGAQF